MQLGVCADCGEEHDYYEIDHKRYAEDITINDLQLLCEECHKIKTAVGYEHYIHQVKHCPTCKCYEHHEQ